MLFNMWLYRIDCGNLRKRPFNSKDEGNMFSYVSHPNQNVFTNLQIIRKLYSQLFVICVALVRTVTILHVVRKITSKKNLKKNFQSFFYLPIKRRNNTFTRSDIFNKGFRLSTQVRTGSKTCLF